MLLDFLIALSMFYFFRKTGLYFVIIVNIILCNLQVIKLISLFGITATLGNILYGSIFFATDLLGEVYGKEEAKKGVILGFIALFYMTIVLQLTLWFQPAGDDFAHTHMTQIFGFMPRIVLGSFLAYVVSQSHDVWAFHFLKDRFQSRHLWLRNNVSTAISQLIDSTIFTLVAFMGMFETRVLIEIFITTYLLKLVVGMIDTPFVYLGRAIAHKHSEAYTHTA
ncbi:MAG: hypothetical protein B6244_09880 [Candidatus Cloacimonetes bacterium 4572_55]|nr:MAG: hypothetical protein B6244_09880 [Candidatus Cloacimonetes bacterium 4572_55]